MVRQNEYTRVYRLRCAPKSPCTWWQESGWVSQWSATPSPELSATRSVTRGERPTWSVHTKQYQRLCFPCPASPTCVRRHLHDPPRRSRRKPHAPATHLSQRRPVKVIRAVTACSLDEGAEGGCGDAVVEAEGCGGWVDYQSRSEGVAEPVSQRGEVAGIGGPHRF